MTFNSIWQLHTIRLKIFDYYISRFASDKKKKQKRNKNEFER